SHVFPRQYPRRFPSQECRNCGGIYGVSPLTPRNPDMQDLYQMSQSASPVSCLECKELELSRSSWVQCYVELLKKRKLFLLDGRLPSRDLSESLAQAETE